MSLAISYNHLPRVSYEVGTVLDAGDTKINEIWCLIAGICRLVKETGEQWSCCVTLEGRNTARHTRDAVHCQMLSSKKAARKISIPKASGVVDQNPALEARILGNIALKISAHNH